MQKICSCCGKEFEVDQNKFAAKFCSPDCRRKNKNMLAAKYRDQKRTKPRVAKPTYCKICGNKIDFSVRGDRAVTCSVECAKENNRRLCRENDRKRNQMMKDFRGKKQNVVKKNKAIKAGWDYGKRQSEQTAEMVKVYFPDWVKPTRRDNNES